MKIDIEAIITNWFQTATYEDRYFFIERLFKDEIPVTMLHKNEGDPTQAPKPVPTPIQQPARKKPERVKPTVLGKTFSSLKSAAEYFDIPYHRIQYRHNRGWTIEKMFKEAYEKSKKNKVLRRNPDGSIGVATIGDS